ncbi:acetylornithine transaminase [Oceanobacillus piezotolerans]|uniref:Acetylornithine aminotransferase n=1 Tax=Oceanobacillus piezotolerans TaxID=2448030 RepID=A0A498D8J9_9BACI|nr:acetylornithine transaminase [Oceanobacillus piezotolerans]RLL44951.1 acetylornithine transaminase [Oceanobacillus piezotolerans]
MSNTEVKSAVMSTYSRFPITVVKGKGSHVWDEAGRTYLDYTSGIATCNLGHVPDTVQEKLNKQLDLIWHCSNLYHNPNQEALAELLAENSALDKVFFCNSGAEANEAAIKLAKKYAKDKGNPERIEIVTFLDSFHGRTGSAMAATAQAKIHEGFSPITPGFRYLPYNDCDSLEQINNGKTTAVLLELVQGEGGVHPVNPSWLKQLEAVCKENDILLMIDEIQTGIGRTGSLFAYQQYDVDPDVITLAKGLASGFPIGAMLAKDNVSNSFTPGTHGSTFGGNPLATSAGLATLEVILSEPIMVNVIENSNWLFSELNRLMEYEKQIKEIRGVGFLIGIEIAGDVAEWITKFRNKGILVLAAGPKTIRILPPLTTTKEELETFVNTFQALLNETGEYTA